MKCIITKKLLNQIYIVYDVTTQRALDTQIVRAIEILRLSHIHARIQKVLPEGFKPGSNFGKFFVVIVVVFFSWWGEERSKYHCKWAIIGPPAIRHWKYVSLACHCWPNIEWLFGSIAISQGSGPVLLRNPIFLWFFRGGVLSPPPPLWISTCTLGQGKIQGIKPPMKVYCQGVIESEAWPTVQSGKSGTIWESNQASEYIRRITRSIRKLEVPFC